MTLQLMWDEVNATLKPRRHISFNTGGNSPQIMFFDWLIILLTPRKLILTVVSNLTVVSPLPTVYQHTKLKCPRGGSILFHCWKAISQFLFFLANVTLWVWRFHVQWQDLNAFCSLFYVESSCIEFCCYKATHSSKIWQ